MPTQWEKSPKKQSVGVYFFFPPKLPQIKVRKGTGLRFIPSAVKKLIGTSSYHDDSDKSHFLFFS